MLHNVAYNYESFREFLELGCGCTYVGKPMPGPYMSEDDMPDLYKCHKNKHFSVPLPDDNLIYSAVLIAKIIENNNLEYKPYESRLVSNAD